MSGLRRKKRKRSRNHMVNAKNEQTGNDEQKSTKGKDHPENPVSPIPAINPQPKPSRTHYEITCHKEKNWWDKTKPWVEIAGIVLLAIYTFYTIKMYCANRD